MKKIWSVEILNKMLKPTQYFLFAKYNDAREFADTMKRIGKDICILQKQIL